MRYGLGNTAEKNGVLVFPNVRENADTTELCFTAGPARTPCFGQELRVKILQQHQYYTVLLVV